MAKQKKPTLLDAIASMEAVSSKKKSWHESLRESDPETHGELLDVVKDFLNGGVSFKKLGSQNALRRCLEQQKAIPKISQGSFSSFLEWVGNNDEATN